jgi:hypothetical protein
MADAGPNNQLRALASRITTVQGTALFPVLAQFLASLLHATEVVIGEAADDLHAHTLGVCVAGAVQPNYTFPLAGTPGDALLHAQAADEDAPEIEPAGCFGLALQDGEGRALGFVYARSEADLQLSEPEHCLVEIVSVLLTAELQLMRTERQRASLDSQVHHLKSRLDGIERAEVSAAATGLHRAPAFAPPSMNLDDTEATGLHHVQREHILRVLNATRWVIEGNSGAALKLGMKPATLRHRMKKLGIARLRMHP